MKLKNLIMIAIAVTNISYLGCKKDSAFNQTPASNAGKVIRLENVNFSHTVIPNKLANYDEQACSVKTDTSWWVGTICFASVGNSCSSAHPCTPIQSTVSSGQFTKNQIDRKIELIEKAYGVKYIY